MDRPRLAGGLLCLLIACSACSCAKRGRGELPVFPVSGQVLFDGQPTPGATVVLHPLNDPHQTLPRPRGSVDRDGYFSLTTYHSNDGAPAGDYVVTVDWRKEGRGQRRGAPPLLPARYCAPAESPLRATVEPGVDHLEPFEIPRPQETAALQP